jgi:hypothetical protein
METPGHLVGITRICRLEGCPNELTHLDPTRGKYTNMCKPCRMGETGPGARWRAEHGMTPAAGQEVVPTGAVAAGEPLDRKAQRLVSLAKDAEQKIRRAKVARREAIAAVRGLDAAMNDLREAVQGLIAA